MADSGNRISYKEIDKLSVPVDPLQATSGKKLTRLYRYDTAIETELANLSKPIIDLASRITTDVYRPEFNELLNKFNELYGIIQGRVNVYSQGNALLIEQFLEKVWYCLYYEVDKDNYDFIYSIDGLKTRLEEIKIKCIKHFPKTVKELEALYKICNESSLKIRKLKEEIESKQTVVHQTNKKDSLSDIPDKPDDLNTSRWVYDIELYYIRPDGKKINIESYLGEFMYYIDFDSMVMPVLSTRFILSDPILRDFKNHFENLAFYITIDKHESSPFNPSNNTFSLKTRIIDNKRIRGIDPKINTSISMENNGMKDVPRHDIKLDFVFDRDAKTNAANTSRVFTNVRVLDVIMALVSETAARIRKSEDTKNQIKIAITPPDNNTVYDQIIVRPGNLSQSLKFLQEDYGVYRTGIRVFMDSNTLEKKDNNESYSAIITVTEKGNNAPIPSAIKNVMIEVIGPSNKSTLDGFESGSLLNSKDGTLLIRTIHPYTIDKNNSPQILNGDSLRVLNSSQNEYMYSKCEINEFDNSMQRTYWSNTDNPFALTQVADAIKEKDIVIFINISDIDPLLLNNNLQYYLKFFSEDDSAYSGDYRCKSMAFYFQSNNGKPMMPTNLVINGSLEFTNIPPLSVDGNEVPRLDYSGKLDQAMAERSYEDRPVYFNNNEVTPSLTSTKNTFNPTFFGKQDFLGQTIPKEIKGNYKMSDTVFFEDIYVTKDGVNLRKGHTMMQKFEYFIYAQKFSKIILDPVFAVFGKNSGAGGKFNSFYRVDIPAGGAKASKHLVGLACDSMLTTAGNPLAEAFFKLMNMSLDYDQIILEGNGSQWRWIHIQYVTNGANRRECRYIKNSLRGGYKLLNRRLITDSKQLYFEKLPG